jgi:hypothetical protein
VTTESTAVPANARIEAVRFDDAAATLHVTLRGRPEEVAIRADAVAALFGGRIRHEGTTAAPIVRRLNPVTAAVTVTTGIPLSAGSLSPQAKKEKVSTAEELHYVLALRADGIDELWYLVAASFNFRKALGAEAGYSGELNMRAFVKRLAAFAPHAVQDSFFTATLLGSALPPPIDSLLEFFRYAGAT